jgi:hypothetical protein
MTRGCVRCSKKAFKDLKYNKINKTFKIIIKSGTLSLAACPVVFFGGVKKDWTRAATMLDETPELE